MGRGIPTGCSFQTSEVFKTSEVCLIGPHFLSVCSLFLTLHMIHLRIQPF